MSRVAKGRMVGRSIGTLALAALLTGCATITYDTGTLQQAVAMNRAAAEGTYERVGSFEEQTRAVFVIADLITVVDSKMADILQRELARTGGDAVINLRIHEEYDIIDAAIAVVQSALLFGGRVVGTRTITYRGEIVRFTGGGDFSAADEAQVGQCLALEVPAEAGGSRTGHVCAPDGVVAAR